MDSKKKQARFEMLKALSKAKSGEMHSPKGEKLKEKKDKLKKVTVVAKDKEGLEEGLSKAKQILKAKLGKMFDESGEDEHEHEEDCEHCEGEGCGECEEEDAEE